MESYSPGQIEKKWQKVWQEKQIDRAQIPASPQVQRGEPDRSPSDPGSNKKPKYYALVEFPYPSGAGLHVGHVRAWSAMDAFVRKKRMQGYNVLFPMGWDAFGLPAENYAIKKGVHPSTTTAENIANFKRQIQSLGLSFDWSREINTTDPKYYKWTQWIFLKLMDAGLAYQKEVPVNWCPSCRTNLADEEVLPDGNHERCGKPTEKRLQKQWLLAITKYADRLIEDLKKVDFPSKVSVQQINWIGRKEGATIKFTIDNPQLTISHIDVFTTRADTLFGATFLVIAPEHPLLADLLSSPRHPELASGSTPSVMPDRDLASRPMSLDSGSPSGMTGVMDKTRLEEIRKYVERAKSKSEQERIAEGRKKTGVFSGVYAVNPATGKEIPVWVADYVLSSYGTGAIMAVPAHDDRDLAFAKEYSLPIVPVVGNNDAFEEPYEGDGELINSGPYTGQKTEDARKAIVADLEKNNLAKFTVTYHLHDWIFSRQHYWGEPIPVVHCPKCGVVPVPEDQLPVELPFVEKYEPSGTGESPLSTMTDWVNTICPKCGGPAKRETDTMPNWAGSNWYFLRYLDPQNDQEIASRKLMETWMPVDVYEGGYEHTTLHLLYSRFIYKFLFDIGVVPTPEPYAARRVHGIVLGPDNRKMSKSFGNVLNPDEIVEKFGADTLRMYEMFIGPFAETVTWNMNGVAGVYRFLGRVYSLFTTRLPESESARRADSGSQRVLVLLSKLAKKVSLDLDNMKFNTAVSSLMEFTNEITNDQLPMTNDDWDVFLRILAPMAPHLAEELYQRLRQGVMPDGDLASRTQKTGSRVKPGMTSDGGFVSVHQQPWPDLKVEEVEQEVSIVVQVNGKVREILKMDLTRAKTQDVVQAAALDSAKVKKHLEGFTYTLIFVPGKLINFVT